MNRWFVRGFILVSTAGLLPGMALAQEGSVDQAREALVAGCRVSGSAVAAILALRCARVARETRREWREGDTDRENDVR